MEYILMGSELLDLEQYKDGKYTRVLKRNVHPNTKQLGFVVEYEAEMERHIRLVDGQEYFHVLDRHGNTIR